MIPPVSNPAAPQPTPTVTSGSVSYQSPRKSNPSVKMKRGGKSRTGAAFGGKMAVSAPGMTSANTLSRIQRRS